MEESAGAFYAAHADDDRRPRGERATTAHTVISRVERASRWQSRDPARQGWGTARLCRLDPGPVLRSRLRDGPGSTVADGPLAPPCARSAGRNPRRKLCPERPG